MPMAAVYDRLKAYFSQRQEVVAAYLFGSHAENRARPDSDVDVGVLLAAEASSRAGALKILYIAELGRILRKDVHPVILNTAGEELLKQMFSKGRCLQVNDQRSFALFQMSAYCRIADFDHYRKMAQRGLGDRLRQEVQNA